MGFAQIWPTMREYIAAEVQLMRHKVIFGEKIATPEEFKKDFPILYDYEADDIDIGAKDKRKVDYDAMVNRYEINIQGRKELEEQCTRMETAVREALEKEDERLKSMADAVTVAKETADEAALHHARY